MTRADRIAFLGTGLMGRPMAANLIGSGFELTVWNRTPAKARSLVARGARLASTARDAGADADIVVTMLQDGPVVEHVLFDLGLLETMSPGAVLVDMSSIPPAVARAHGRRAAAAGLGYVDAPVSGGTRGAEAGSLAIMAGGGAEAVERVRPVLEVLGRVTPVGPVGSGQLAKCVNQVIVGVTIGALAEGLLLARQGGADPTAVRTALSGGFADSRILAEHGKRMLERDFAPGAPARGQVKDLRTAMEAVEELDLPLTRSCLALFEQLVDAGDHELDHSALLLELERRNGLEPPGD